MSVLRTDRARGLRILRVLAVVVSLSLLPVVLYSAFDLRRWKEYSTLLAIPCILMGYLLKRLRASERLMRDREKRLDLTQQAAGVGAWEWDVDAGVAAPSALPFGLA